MAHCFIRWAAVLLPNPRTGPVARPLCISVRTVASQALPSAVPMGKALPAGMIPIRLISQRLKLSIPLTGLDESFSRTRHRPNKRVRSGPIPMSDTIAIENGIPVGASGVNNGLSGRTVLSFHPLVIVSTGRSRGIRYKRASPIGAPPVIPLSRTPASTALLTASKTVIGAASALPTRVRGLSFRGFPSLCLGKGLPLRDSRRDSSRPCERHERNL
uniref:Uncharacterized protein n=1 Tax=Chromera velia CCMP2878 TaxID=1169474 RepID=A0A0G4HGJ4_9ALVE|eukprot:Cvel_27262.t1-p1 / transcript=Cvel_27262.t1 / gene=Cvel_27262 / organism=Chromera_velia_CCMP2878 / gene_product=hypothetical protein / transcript_product=hypothetical protein / location=Cvel_scaffold3376:6032-6676(-) / protein_length=215 / sequence_SO=supercontig / SO=protein_coding / is_pseudo=false